MIDRIEVAVFVAGLMAVAAVVVTAIDLRRRLSTHPPNKAKKPNRDQQTRKP